MPKLNKSALEQSHETVADSVVNTALPAIVVSSVPTLICGVNRKVNIGNFESIDLYAGLTLPMVGASLEDLEELKDTITQVAEFGYHMTSQQTYERYLLIKEAQKNPKA